MDVFDNLTGYEKGALARALLTSLIKQGSLDRLPKEQMPGEITISVERWQLELLARFSDTITDDDEADTVGGDEILLDQIC